MPVLTGSDILGRPGRIIGGSCMCPLNRPPAAGLCPDPLCSFCELLSDIRTNFSSDPTPRKPSLKERIQDKLASTKEYLIFAKDEIIDIITEIRVLRVPLLNWGIILMYGAWLIRLTLRFTKLYAQHALLTMMITNLLLYGLADTLAQTLRSMVAFKPEARPERSTVFVKYILEKGRPRRVILDEEDDDLLELGLDPDLLLEDHEDHEAAARPGLPASQPEVFHFRRLALFSVWGVIISFFQSPWYAFLNGSYNEDNKFLSALKRVLTDQLCFSPICK